MRMDIPGAFDLPPGTRNHIVAQKYGKKRLVSCYFFRREFRRV
jgi:hypothetical protein